MEKFVGDEIQPPTKKLEAAGWFLTFPQCPLKKEEMLAALQAKLDLLDYVVAEEKHEDGSPHLHCFLKLATKFYWNAKKFPRYWDVEGYHPHVETARSWKCCAAYCKKEGCFLSSIDVDAARHKKAAHNKEMLAMDPKDAVDQGYCSLLALPTLLKAKRAYENLAPVPLLIERKCYWIWGPPRAGKSYACRAAYPELYEKPQNKWWDGYNGETAVLLDDFDKAGACLGHYLKIWADGYRFNAECKGGMLRPCYTVLLLTSNYRPEDIFSEDKELCAAVAARFQLIELADRAGQDTLIKKIIN